MDTSAPARAGRSLAGVALAVLVAAVAVACGTLERGGSPSGDAPTAAAEWPPVGEVTTLPGGRIKATGVVARYALEVHGTTAFYWALYADTGSATSAPSVIAALDPDAQALLGSVSATSQPAALRLLDGKIVTVEGALGPRGMRTDYRRLSADAAALAPSAVQQGVDWSNSLVRPGKWFEDEARRLLFYAFEELEANGDAASFSDPRDAARIVGKAIRVPTSPRVGRLVGVRLDGEGSPARRGWTLVFADGFSLSAVPASTASHRAKVRRIQERRARERIRARKRSDPPSTRRVYIRGHVGTVHYSRQAGTTYANYLDWWEEEATHWLAYWGPFRQAPSETELVEIARSMKPLD